MGTRVQVARPRQEENRMSELTVLPVPYDDIIREHYAREARAHGAMPTSTMADEIVRAKETNAILATVTGFIQEQTARDAANGKSTTDRCLHIVDLGCGNGTTLEHLASKIYFDRDCLHGRRIYRGFAHYCARAAASVRQCEGHGR